MTRMQWRLDRAKRFTDEHETLMDAITLVGILAMGVLLYLLAACQHQEWIAGIHK